MNYYLISFLAIVIPFAIISIWQDIKIRKVKNYVNISFFYISFLVFIFFLREYDFWFYLCLLFSFLISYWFFKKDYWGGADGKIFISLTLLVLALGNYFFYIDWILNLLLIYVISIILIVLFKTKLKSKIEVFKNIDFTIYFFQILLIFIFLKNVLKSVVFVDPIYSLLFLILVFVGFKFLTPVLKKYFEGFSFKKKLSLNIILFIIFIGMSYYHLIVILYFFLILFFRISSDFISSMTELLKDKKGDKYYSPFSIYLFISAIFTMIVGNNLIEFLIEIWQLFF